MHAAHLQQREAAEGETSNAIKPNPIAARGAMEMDLKFMVAVLKDLRDD